jgi:hypothetical protein
MRKLSEEQRDFLRGMINFHIPQKESHYPEELQGLEPNEVMAWLAGLAWMFDKVNESIDNATVFRYHSSLNNNN